MLTTPMERSCIPPKKRTRVIKDGHPGIEKSGSSIFFPTNMNKNIKLIKVMAIPRMLEKYRGLSVNAVNPLTANLKYLAGENVDLPA